MFASQSSSETAAAEDNPEPVSFDAVLTTKLRRMVPHLQVLGHGTLHRAVLSYVEELLLRTVLTACRGNQMRAADLLGINRNTLRKKLREFNITVPRGGGGTD
jgi:two-component system nitrogen regulation response regulator GlnG